MFPPSAWMPNGAKPFGMLRIVERERERLERRVERVDAARCGSRPRRAGRSASRGRRRARPVDELSTATTACVPLTVGVQPRIWPACVSKRNRDDAADAVLADRRSRSCSRSRPCRSGRPATVDGQRVLRSEPGVERRGVGLVVGRPPRRGGGGAEAPAVDERRVGERRRDRRAVGDERIHVVGDERRGAGSGRQERERGDDARDGNGRSGAAQRNSLDIVRNLH